ncbi:hypothetical protein CKAN_00680600 [Cinnamomum micranthum f. kanehirae]|uniref:DUF810 domain-containing protein n=1 Tax=Cinnamomum micranthum f. kanehirae TaxID=337451 RepID=A0A3S3NEW7_9MAGN|nr:hypothetical protein CKAN_00680600 [Cinnamomum micranthum f. kanehirae]
MVLLFRNAGVGNPRSEVFTSIAPISDLPSPFGDLGCSLSDSELRETAYEIFVGACRSSARKALPCAPKAERSLSLSLQTSSSSSPSSPQKSLTWSAASKMKAAFGFGSSSKGSPSEESKKPITVGELVRIQMGISEEADSRIQRALLRFAAGQHERPFEFMVLPLELLQQFKASDFHDPQEYEGWQERNLKLLEAGLLLHPLHPLPKGNPASQGLHQILRGASERLLDTGRNSESMQVLRSAVTSLAYRSYDGSAPERCHWADGYPLNFQLYQMLLEACFDRKEKTLIIEEVDEVIELIKKTWVVLGLNQMLHNLCFSWVVFNRFIVTGQVESNLLFSADNQLAEVAKDVKAAKDPAYAKILSTILGWAEKQLLTYHDTFHPGNICLMQSIVSLGVSAAKILAEDISREFRRRRKERMEKADQSRRASKNHPNPIPVLSILAKDISDLAFKEKELFSPLLKKWHPLAAGVAVATLHACYGNEFKQFISGVSELTLDAVQVLKSADKLEKDLVQIVVEDSADSEDGGKMIIREMPPYEAESAIANLTRTWIKTKVDRFRQQNDRSLQQEDWNPRSNKENFASSAEKVMCIADETFNAFFQLPIPMHSALLPDLMTALDRSLQQYIFNAISGCGTRNTYIPTMPALTRCTTKSKLHGVWKKRDKSQISPQKKSQVGTLNGGDSRLAELCVRINTLHHVQIELEALEKRIVSYFRNAESAHVDIVNGFQNKFELSLSACQEGIQQLFEATAYKLVFHDLSHVLWDGLYVGEAASSRIEPFRKELHTNLNLIFTTVHNRVRNRLITAIMKASFDGFLLVLLAGGPSRAFCLHDSQIIEDDFAILKDIYMSHGEGLPKELVDKAANPVRSVLPLFHCHTETLIEQFRRSTLETYGSSAISSFSLPPTSGHWNPTEPNTILRVLCYRNDEVASKFLKRTYNLPKKL